MKDDENQFWTSPFNLYPLSFTLQHMTSNNNHYKLTIPFHDTSPEV